MLSAEVATFLQFGALGLLGYMIYLFHAHIERESRCSEELRRDLLGKVTEGLEEIRRAMQKERAAFTMAVQAIKAFVATASHVDKELRDAVMNDLRRASDVLAGESEDAQPQN